MTNTYTNYLEQVNSSVSGMVRVDYEEMLLKADNYDDMAFNYIAEDGEEVDVDVDVYQWYVVNIYGEYETEETNKLGIFYSEMLGAYIMPVSHFGTMWNSVEPVDISEFLNV